MEQNVNSIDALARLTVGCLMIMYLIVGGPWWSICGLYLLASGAFRFCIFYFYFFNKEY